MARKAKPAGEHMTVTQAATLLDVSRTRVWQFIADGRLTAETVGSIALLKRADVLAFARHAREPGRPKQE
jgi:excisionase family DNA binding protein